MALIASNGTGGGAYSVGASWAGGVAPGLGDNAQVAAGDTITIDATFAVGNDTGVPALDILNGGFLDWDNLGNDTCDFQGDFYVRAGGTLTLNGAAAGGNTLTIQLNRSAALLDGKYGLIVEDNGIVNCDGFNKTRSWDTLSADAAAAQANVVTTNDNSAVWNVGDEFVVGSMSTPNKAGAETDTIGAFPGGNVITKAVGVYGSIHEEDVAFINLTRNVQFTSWNIAFEGYIRITNSTPGQVAFDWCEFSYLGSNAANKYGITVAAADYATLNYCSLHHCYRGLSGTATTVWTLDNDVFGLNVHHDAYLGRATGTAANLACLGSDNIGINWSVTLVDSQIGNCDSAAAQFFSLTSCRIYSNTWGAQSSTIVATFDSCYFDNNTFRTIDAAGSITRLIDCSFGVTTANTLDIYADCIVIGTGINTIALTVTVAGSADNRVSIEDTANNHKTWKVSGSYEKQAVVRWAGANAVLMNPTDAANPLVAPTTVFATNGETVAYSCYMRKSALMAVLPFVRLSGKGIVTSTATMTNSVGAWELLTVSGIATSDGFCQLELVCQNGAGNVYVDDDYDSYAFWFQGDVPSVVPKPEMTANDIFNTIVRGIGWSADTFGDMMNDIDTDVAAILVDTDIAIPASLTTIQADLDNPNQYKADVSALATAAALATAQADLDNPSQYQADVSALALEANVEGHATAALNTYDPPTRAEATADKDAIIVEVDANETKIDALPTAAGIDAQLSGTHGAGAWDGSEADWTVAEKKQIRDAIGVDGDKVTAASGQIQTIQADLDDPDQYKANVSALAIEANVTGHVTTSLNAYDPPTRTEATADKAEIIVKVNVNETKIDAVQTDLDDPDQYKANVSALATAAALVVAQADITEIKNIEGGRWKIIDNQMIFYEADNVTEAMRFNLFNSAGDPSMGRDVVERVRV